MAHRPHALLSCLFALTACQAAPDPCAGTPVPASAIGQAYVVNAITLPVTRDPLAIDLDGDGVKDNMLGNIVNVVDSWGLADPQALASSAVASGSSILLLQTSAAAGCPGGDNLAVDLQAGLGTTAPDYSGHGTFAVDAVAPGARFLGQLADSAFESDSPVTSTAPVPSVLRLSFFGEPPVPLPTVGTHLEVTISPGGLMSGRLQGSILLTDVHRRLFPAWAAYFTRAIQANPYAPQSGPCPGLTDGCSDRFEPLFDRGGCTDVDGMIAVEGDKVIAPCEVATSDLVANLWVPSIQLYDPPGSNHYAPVPRPKVSDKKDLDAIPFAIGFTAVPATIGP